MTAKDQMRSLWEKFFTGKTVSRSAIFVGGEHREMTEREVQLMDEAFAEMDKPFRAMERLFDEARAENARRKEGK